MMRPDYRAVDHVSAGIALHHLGQRLQQGVEHPGLDPAPVAPEHAVPLAIFVGKMPPLRARPRHPHHALEIGPIVSGRPTSATIFRRQQRTDQRPLLIRYPDPLAQRRLQKAALNQPPSLKSSFVHDA